jgi:hypothetical protein
LTDQLPGDQHPGEVFDRLYLRSALADVFQPLGLDAEAAYRAAARVRLLVDLPESAVARPGALAWDNADIAWLTGLHTADGHRYFNKESHEQMLWWLRLPQLIALAEVDPSAKSASTREAMRAMESEMEAATREAQTGGFRLDDLLRSRSSQAPPTSAAIEPDRKTGEATKKTPRRPEPAKRT